MQRSSFKRHSAQTPTSHHAPHFGGAPQNEEESQDISPFVQGANSKSNVGSNIIGSTTLLNPFSIPSISTIDFTNQNTNLLSPHK
mmetsp:Transcript_32714/g.29597  ORF Transcript_32714/g.29597 Transcript_32714/m.29597 type:complete len:85 (+) Transcript_32714:382-636(+)